MRRIADYTFTYMLGQGQQGMLFLAPPPGRLGVQAEFVAVKVLTRTVGDDEFRRVADEFLAVAAITSPHLATRYEVGREEGRFFYSMEYLPLGSIMTPARPLSQQEVVAAVAAAARGAHALHEGGIAHRDIKPSNVLLRDGGAVLADIGLAHVVSPGQTVSGLGGVGSIEYLEPGVMSGGKATRASDIWSLGATLHRVMAGRSIYGALPDSDLLTLLRHIAAQVPQIDPSLPPALAAVIGQCLKPDPAERPPTALDLAERLQAIPVAP